PVRVGVIGAGSLGFHHIRILRDMESVAFAGFMESREDRADEVSKELDVRRYADEQSLLADVDAVTIVVPTSAHFDVAKAALDAGKHVFIEKPITTTLEQADELLDIARKHGALVQIGHVERFNRAVRAALPYVHRPRFIESERLALFSMRGSDVAVVLDLMIHDIDLVLTLVGDTAEEISAVGVPVLTPMLDIANARVTFSSGAVANITSSRISRDRVRKIRIFQESGYMSLDLAAGTGNFFRLKEKLDPSRALSGPVNITDFVDYVPLTAPEGEPLRLEFDSFIAAIRGEAPVVVTGEDGRRALAVALRIVAEIERTRPAFTGVAVPSSA
ncbi:MAG TPA: Gfo/Idh/MocA family oxidoreductase, partial [Gemmatimonadaceae bacterium]|nr:Gfo/Idh/MocA family oxidoreductase [Gemmatimonadaceae bacterium]